jgi:hypothetical protein
MRVIRLQWRSGMPFTDGMRTAAYVLIALIAAPAAQAQLTETETRWLGAATPVLTYAQASGLPVDVVVQPQAEPGAAPLAMGFVEGRCKLVLTMRGDAARPDAALEGAAPALKPLLMEAMAAHELGHCWRHLRGASGSVPAGFVPEPTPVSGDDAERARWRAEMAATRREEGFADLVGLAWTLRRHPAQYAAVHAWLSGVRAEPAVAGSHHDTRAWVRLAADAGALAGAESPFEPALALWQRGLDAAP